MKEYLAGKLGSLCKTCNERFQRNPMRILDCKVDADKLTDAPQVLDYLCEECRDHFARLKEYLDVLGVAYEAVSYTHLRDSPSHIDPRSS